MGFSTKAVHAGIEADPSTGSLMTPIHLTSTYLQAEIGKHKGYVYSRVANPTRTVLEKSIASLENGKEGLAFASGMAAETAVFHLLKAGDHAVISRNVYGGTFRVAKFVLENFGLHFEFVDTTDIHVLKEALKPNTRMVFVETPTNPTMEITDLRAVAKLCKAKKVISVVDNTFATPYLQNPLDFGIDIVLHSATKYLNGHSDMLGGLVVLNDPKLTEQLRFIQKSVGGILSPFEAWMCLRGIKTLAIRMARHDSNAVEVAAFLNTNRKVKKVNYPGLVSHPQHYLALGRKTDAEREIAVFERKYGERDPLTVAEFYACRKDADHAMSWLERFWEEPGPTIDLPNRLACLRNIESDPRYKALLLKWRQTAKPGA